jgi:WS/DGAT/MGAT family acyltransferase
MLELGADALRAASVAARALVPAPPAMPVSGGPVSRERHLATLERDVTELRDVRTRFECTLNDVLLAAVAGALRSFMRRAGEAPDHLRALVPVSVQPLHGDDGTGGRIGFMLVDLPCEEPDPARRIRLVQEEVSRRRRSGDDRGMRALLTALSWTPGPVRRLAARTASGPRPFNLSVTSLPGPMDLEPALAGCPLVEAYPIVPLADGHSVSIATTTIDGKLFVGLYADPQALDADELAADLDVAISELAALAVADAALETIHGPVRLGPSKRNGRAGATAPSAGASAPPPAASNGAPRSDPGAAPPPSR